MHTKKGAFSKQIILNNSSFLHLTWEIGIQNQLWKTFTLLLNIFGFICHRSTNWAFYYPALCWQSPYCSGCKSSEAMWPVTAMKGPATSYTTHPRCEASKLFLYFSIYLFSYLFIYSLNCLFTYFWWIFSFLFIDLVT